MDTVRSIAVDILVRIEEKGAFAAPLLDAALSADRLSNSQDRRLLTQIVYGTLRLRGRIDWIIARFYRGRIDDLEADVKNILRMSLYQLFFTQRIPQFAICDEAVKIAKSLNPKASGLVNAILRNAIRKVGEITYPNSKESPVLSIAVFHSHPLWLVEKWLKRFGFEETAALCRANNEIPPAAVRVNRLKTTPDEAIRQLNEEGFEATASSWSPDGLILTAQSKPLRETRNYQNGHIQMQDEASQLIAHLVNPQPGEAILDLCAGTGGKTTHLAQRMNNVGKIFAVDINRQKLDDLQTNAHRQGVSIIKTVQGDASGRLTIEPKRQFNRILIDAPCSGLGTLRRNPEIKWRLQPLDIQKSATLQKQLIASATPYLKDGGAIIYTTCTTLMEENEAVIKDFMDRHRDFHVLSPQNHIPEGCIDRSGFFKTRTPLTGMDGFFGAFLSC